MHNINVQGTYVEGIKEEVVLSPGHALSFIAAGEGICPNSFSPNLLLMAKAMLLTIYTDFYILYCRAPSCWFE